MREEYLAPPDSFSRVKNTSYALDALSAPIGGKLYINDRLMQEDHQVEQGNLYVEKGRLLEGDFATLGDNRAVSAASAIHPIINQS